MFSKIFSPCTGDGPLCALRPTPVGGMINFRCWGGCAPLFFLEACHGTVLDPSHVDETVPSVFSVGPQAAPAGTLCAVRGAAWRPPATVSDSVVCLGHGRLD